MKHPILIAFSLIVLLLGGCSTLFGDDDAKAKKDEPKEAKAKPVTPICPQVAIIRQLETLRDYGGEQPDPAQLVTTAKMTQIVGDCDYTKTGVDISYTLDMVAGRGPRLGGRHIDVPFFVAVVDPANAILTKDKLSAAIDFPENSRFAPHTEKLHVFIPLSDKQRDTGPFYRVLAGFQLTDAQLAAAPK